MKVKPHQLVLAIIAALLVHVLVLFTLSKIQPPQPTAPEPQKISVRLQKPSIPKRVVRTEREKTDTPPKNADFLGEFNNQVVQQTQSKTAGSSPVSFPRRRQSSPGSQVRPGMTNTQPNLMPDWRELEKLGEDADAKNASETRLNTFEWKHASYFNRIRDAISRVWAPQMAIRRYDPQGKLLGKQSRTTVVEVTLDPNGNLLNASIQTPSGVFYLDEAALQAFQKAGPFPNPPKVLFAQRDQFSFNFGFRISIEQGFSLDFD